MRRIWIVVTLTVLLLLTAGAQEGLEEYPQLFVKNNALDVTIVYGEQASGRVTGAAYALVDSLRTRFSQGAISTDTDVDDEEIQSFSIEDLELEEYIGDEQETVTESDFPELLSSGTISNSKGDTDYEQYLRFETADGLVKGVRFVYDVYDEQQGLYLLGEKDEILFEWEIDFDRYLASDIENTILEDILDEEFNVLGTDMVITQAKVTGNDLELSLLSKEQELYLLEGHPQNIVIDGESYTITAQSILDGSSEVILAIDGETSDTLGVGERDKIGDLYIAVAEILLNEAQEGSRDTATTSSFDTSQFQSMSESQIRAYLAQSTTLRGEDVAKVQMGKILLEFKDTYTDNIFSNTAKINGNTLDDASVKMIGNKEGNEFRLDKILYHLKIDPAEGNDLYAKEGEGVREHLEEPESMLSTMWDIVFEESEERETSEVHFEPSNDELYTLKFLNTDGDTCEVPLLDNSNDSGLGFTLGDDDNKLYFVECATGTSCIERESYLFLTDDRDHTGLTTVLEYKSYSDTSKKVTFKNLCTDQTFEESYTGSLGNASGDITLGGQDFRFSIGANGTLAVDQNKDGNIESLDKAVIVTQGGLLIDLGSTNTPLPSIDQGFTVNLSIEEELFDESGPFDFGGDESVTFSFIRKSSNKVDLLIQDQSHLKLQSGEEPDVNKGMSPYGVLYTYTDESGEAGELVLEVPETQVRETVSIIKTTQEQQSSSSSSVDLTAFLQQPTAIDTSIFSATGDNFIVMGNPCTNRIAAKLLNEPSKCDAGFREGTGIIRLFNTGANYQILVAGKTDEDIAKAAKVLTLFQPMQGTLLAVTGTEAQPITAPLSIATWESQFLADLGEGDGDDGQDDVPPLVQTLCSDGTDNDGDGRIDYPLDPGCSSAQDGDETDVVVPPVSPPQQEINPEVVQEEKSKGWIWILVGIILIGGAGGASWWVMRKHKAEEDMPAPEGYTKEQWKQTLAYYKEHYPEWYANYLAWWKQQKKNTKDIALIALLIGVSLIGLAMIITVSLPGETSVGLASDTTGQAYLQEHVITCVHQETGASFVLPDDAPEESLRVLLCAYEGAWQCTYQGVTQELYCS
ncbi:hypothetical protein J4410_07530 [Candidatus Woesearchaeota archaeon]|nr:hypothetical protein [Candidatus Woesearchaeota archaeon]